MYMCMDMDMVYMCNMYNMYMHKYAHGEVHAGVSQ